jgi:DNA-binding response OmpR family regulator
LEAPTFESASSLVAVRTSKVLVVDDNRDAADALVILLRCLGHDARAAYTGGKALELAEDFSPGIVLLDLRLPDISGFDVAQRLRQGLSSDTLLVALSGMDGAETTARVRDAGFDCHYVKPLDPARLEALLAQA